MEQINLHSSLVHGPKAKEPEGGSPGKKDCH